MNSVHLRLLSRLNTAESHGLASAVRRCLREGVTGKADLAHIAGTVLRHLPNLAFEDTTNILSGFANVHYRNFQFFSALVDRLGHVKDIPLKEARVVLRSFSKIHFTNSDITARCADVVKSNIASLRAIETSDLLHALTRLRYNDSELLSKLVDRTLDDLPSLHDGALVNFAVGCAKVSAVSDKTVVLLCQELKARVGTLGPLESLRSLLALAHFRSHEDAVATSTSIVKALNCNLLSLLQLTLVLESVNAIGCQGTEKIAEALLKKRDAQASVPPDLESRIQAALKGGIPGVETTTEQESEASE